MPSHFYLPVKRICTVVTGILNHTTSPFSPVTRHDGLNVRLTVSNENTQ